MTIKNKLLTILFDVEQYALYGLTHAGITTEADTDLGQHSNYL
jgi:hypothetical protein